jgi:DnaJ like chaperone protein
MAGWNGKILGGALGALVGGPIGLAVGFLLGHQYDEHAPGQGGGADSVRRVQQLFFPATFRVMGHIAKADGRVSEQEIAAARALMNALHLTQAQTLEAIEQYTAGKQPGFSLQGSLAELRDAMRPHPQLAQFFMELQLQVAIMGNGLAPAARQRLVATAALLGMSEAYYARLETLMRWRAGEASAGYGTGGGANGAGPQQRGADPRRDAEQLAQAYAQLDIEASASNDEVTKAYRRQMSRHHPDKLKANGLPDSMLERAKERTQQIQAAYELVKSVRGMS